MVGTKEPTRSATPCASPHAAMAYGIYFLGGKIKKQQGYDFL